VPSPLGGPLQPTALSPVALQIPFLQQLQYCLCYYCGGHFKTRDGGACTADGTYRTMLYVVAILPYWFRFAQVTSPAKDCRETPRPISRLRSDSILTVKEWNAKPRQSGSGCATAGRAPSVSSEKQQGVPTSTFIKAADWNALWKALGAGPPFWNSFEQLCQLAMTDCTLTWEPPELSS
jgi:hypothetical protein